MVLSAASEREGRVFSSCARLRLIFLIFSVFRLTFLTKNVKPKEQKVSSKREKETVEDDFEAFVR